MSDFTYSLVETEGNSNITVLVNGKMYVTDSSNPNWQDILEAVRGVGTDEWESLFDPSVKVAKKFERVSDRVTVRGGTVYLDGDPVHTSETEQIVRFMQEGVEDFEPLVKFFEKMAANPDQHSREQFYKWTQRHKFTIDADGDILMYKGVYRDGNGGYLSCHSGPAIVNDVEHTHGQVPQKVGDVIQMARQKVQHNPAVGCATGLHASNYAYASSFASTVIRVKVNPLHVVSVPTECDAQKVRVCQYTVVDEVAGEFAGAYAHSTYQPQPEDDCTECYGDGCFFCE